jgi:hypothetical protein
MFVDPEARGTAAYFSARRSGRNSTVIQSTTQAQSIVARKYFRKYTIDNKVVDKRVAVYSVVSDDN